MIEVNGLTKIYGGNRAVDDLNFRIANGKIYGLLGRNGAGKSTTMNLIAGCLAPTAGTVRINGFDMSEHPVEAKRCIGYLPEIPPLYDDMTPEEFLVFVAEAKRVPEPARPGAVRTALQATGVFPLKDRLIGNLSKGYRQRVGIAMTMLGDPDIIILDEPTVGLDPKQIMEIRSLIRELGRKKTILISSHILSEISELCDEVIVLSHGKLVAFDNIEALEARAPKSNQLTVTVKGDERGVLAVINGVSGVLNAKVTSKRKDTVTVTVRIRTGADPRDDIFFALAAKRYVVLSTETGGAGLEDVFLSLTGDGLTDSADNNGDVPADDTDTKGDDRT